MWYVIYDILLLVYYHTRRGKSKGFQASQTKQYTCMFFYNYVICAFVDPLISPFIVINETGSWKCTLIYDIVIIYAGIHLTGCNGRDKRRHGIVYKFSGKENKMKALFIGGTGQISTAVVKRLAARPGWEIWLLNRGNRQVDLPENVHRIIADINDEEDVAGKIKDMIFDTVCEFIGFTVKDVERDYRLFKGKTRQYIFTSSASAYHKPAASYVVTEGTTLANPHWQYSRDKIACEEFLMNKYREEGFPVTIVRPSHTYDEKHIPLGVHGNKGFWQVIKRMTDGKPVIIQGDGSSLWTMTFNTDFAIGYTGLMGNRHAIGEAFQITGDETLTWNQIYATIADALGVELKAYHVSSDFLAAAGKPYGYDFEGGLTGDKSVSVVFDNSKLKKAVPDMRTNVRFDQGVRIALNYILSHPKECWIEDPVFDRWCDKVIEVLEDAKKRICLQKTDD